MNDKQKEEIREEFLNKTELKGKIGENLLDNLIDKYLTAQREEMVEKIKKHPFENTNFEGTVEEIINLINSLSQENKEDEK